MRALGLLPLALRLRAAPRRGAVPAAGGALRSSGVSLLRRFSAESDAAAGDRIHAPWTAEEDAIVWAQRGSDDLSAAAARLGRGYEGVARRLAKLESPKSSAARRLFGDGDAAAPAADGDPLLLDDAALLAACRVDFRRDSGPGGQKRNKVESAVRLTHAATGAVANCAEDRSQHVNKQRALRRLRFVIARDGPRTPVDLDADAFADADLAGILPWTAAARVGAKSDRRPRAERRLLDVLDAARGSVADAAAYLGGGSTAQLSKVLVKDGDLLAAANRVRAGHALGPLRRRK